jgi:hypothetical protein
MTLHQSKLLISKHHHARQRKFYSDPRPPSSHQHLSRITRLVLLKLLLEVLGTLLRVHQLRLVVDLLLLVGGLRGGRQLGELVGVGGQIADVVAELGRAEQFAGEAVHARVLLLEGAVLGAQQADLVALVGELAFEPGDVF